MLSKTSLTLVAATLVLASVSSAFAAHKDRSNFDPPNGTFSYDPNEEARFDRSKGWY